MMPIPHRPRKSGTACCSGPTRMTLVLFAMTLAYFGVVFWHHRIQLRSTQLPLTIPAQGPTRLFAEPTVEPVSDRATEQEQQQQQQQQQQQEQQQQAATSAPLCTLQIQVCNGFTNQRLSLVYGALLARKTGRALVLPPLLADGTQMTGQQIHASSASSIPLTTLYQLEPLSAALKAVGVEVLPDPPPSSPPPTFFSIEAAGFNGLSQLQGLASSPAVATDCPLFHIAPGDIAKADDTAVVWAVLNGLQPNQLPARQAQAVLQRLSHRPGGREGFNMLHLRIEEDWVAHCDRWEHINDGIVRDNCFSNTREIASTLQVMGLDTRLPLYVTSHWPGVERALNTSLMAQLQAAGFQVVTAEQLGLGPPATGLLRSREVRAQVEYEVAQAALRFIGNSVSTFTALAMLERRQRGKWAAYYNGGNIPITSVLPGLHRLPWVFTYNSWSEEYDYLLKAAVLSAEAHGSLQPLCLFLGNTSSHIGQWLRSHNVTLLPHDPKWREPLMQLAERFRKDNTRHSHLYATPNMLLSTFQRIDLAVTPGLDQYNYVLYTDADVMFKQRITLDDFGLPLPHTVAMSYEFKPNTTPLNAGIMLLNLPQLRRSYPAFLSFILNNTQGLYFGPHGPADQGAFNAFYAQDLAQRILDQDFNAKPYHTARQGTKILHFHGPKPHHYLVYLRTGDCGNFFHLCHQAFATSLCSGLAEWAPYLHEPSAQVDAHHLATAAKLLDACRWLAARAPGSYWTGTEVPTATLLQLHAERWPPASSS
ncbi:hypothetical protein V8C86DRAFT_404853 [Haematococcus lacustris]